MATELKRCPACDSAFPWARNAVKPGIFCTDAFHARDDAPFDFHAADVEAQNERRGDPRRDH